MNRYRFPAILAGLVLLAVILPAVSAGCNEQPTAPDGTCCWKRFNLQEENRLQLAAPTVVDISESTGNILMRGPMPLIIRSGPGNDPTKSPCMNQTDWRFAYSELDQMITAKKSFAPVYLPESKKALLASQLEGFSLDDYHIIVVSLLDHGDINPTYFSAEQRDFGGKYSSCSGPLEAGTIRKQEGNLVWSTVGFCDGGTDCQELLNKDTAMTCSYANLIDQLSTLMEEKDPSGKKRLIYYHCVLGTDRTGGVTIGYLQKTMPSMTFAHAVVYASHLGTEDAVPVWPPNTASKALAKAYCTKINQVCSEEEGTRIMLPGRDTHSHLPGQEDPVMTPPPAPVPQQVPVPVQTPATPYDPAKAGEVTF
ncbi:MAG: hypothetical protein GYA23_03310 [Methanomicrobiales archaeon]|nr:hypothetical protein [Methanomicrobiales archaeon]